MTRRDALAVGAALGGTLLLGGRPSRLWAATPVSAPPSVDRLAVRVVVDGFQDALVRTMKMGAVEVQRVGNIGIAQHLQAEWGLSLHLESQRGAETRNFLLDFGFTPAVLFNNLDIFKIAPASIDALIVSHGHFDHFGGLVPYLRRERTRMRGNLPLYVGGEQSFCYRWSTLPDGHLESFGVLDRRELVAENTRIIMADHPAVIKGHAFTTGAIARKGFEKVAPSTRVEIGVRDGAGCEASHFSAEEQAGKIVFDQFYDEHATCYNVKGRGLVVISSCGHAGIINSIRQAQAVSGVQKVHAVIGGFHLGAAPLAYTGQVVQTLKEIDPDYVIPMHCSGAGFIQMAQSEMPDKLILSYTGSRYIFGA